MLDQSCRSDLFPKTRADPACEPEPRVCFLGSLLSYILLPFNNHTPSSFFRFHFPHSPSNFQHSTLFASSAFIPQRNLRIMYLNSLLSIEIRIEINASEVIFESPIHRKVFSIFGKLTFQNQLDSILCRNVLNCANANYSSY